MSELLQRHGYAVDVESARHLLSARSVRLDGVVVLEANAPVAPGIHSLRVKGHPHHLFEVLPPETE